MKRVEHGVGTDGTAGETSMALGAIGETPKVLGALGEETGAACEAGLLSVDMAPGNTRLG
ncbi:unnamed protein product [Ilex paraguariensis]|uniref:Uncharacterized protein n=1 Tax=Ilex paraguariensis TaxID=185542 RepID=A0ABC8S5J4_9AQUA